jgi:hypothetical protein
MRRWIAWRASLLAGAFCFCPGLRLLWFGRGNEPRDEWALYVCMSVLSLVRQQHMGREFCRNRHKAPLFDLQIHPVSLAFNPSRKRRPKPPLPVPPKIVSHA